MIIDKLAKSYQILSNIDIGYKDFDFGVLVKLAEFLEDDVDINSDLFFMDCLNEATKYLKKFSSLYVSYESVIELAVMIANNTNDDFNEMLLLEAYILLSDYTIGYHTVASDDVLYLYSVIDGLHDLSIPLDKELFLSLLKEAYKIFTILPPHDWNQRGLIDLSIILYEEAEREKRVITYL